METNTLEREAVAQPRKITRRRELPHRRAIVGGFLVTLAVLGVFAAYRRAEAPPETTFVAVTRAVAAGERLEATDLALVPIELPPAQAETLYTNVEALLGAIAMRPVQTNQLLAKSDVREAQGYVAAEEVSFPVTASHALGASLQAGERVDVLATYGTGADAYSMTVVTDALVIARDYEDGFTASDTVEVRLGIEDGQAALALTHAVTQAEVFLVRSPDTTPPTGVYRPAERG